MLAVVHNKLPFPVFIASVVIAPHGTEKIDLPNGFEYDSKRLSVSYIKEDVSETKVESKETAKPKAEEKPVVENKPKPKKKTRKRNTK